MSDAFDQLLAEHPELADLTSMRDVLPASGYRYIASQKSFLDDPYAVVEPPQCEIEFPRRLLTDREFFSLRGQVGRHVHITTNGTGGLQQHVGVLLSVQQCDEGCHVRLILRPDGTIG